MKTLYLQIPGIPRRRGGKHKHTIRIEGKNTCTPFLDTQALKLALSPLTYRFFLGVILDFFIVVSLGFGLLDPAGLGPPPLDVLLAGLLYGSVGTAPGFSLLRSPG